MSQRTFQANKENLERKWYVVDATDKPLGRLASQVAAILRGKHKPIYTPHVDTGDHVIVINADKIRLTGRKLQKKIYYRHTGYPGGIRQRTAAQMLEKQPERVIELAVKRMLPDNRLGRRQFLKLKVYQGDSHPHEAQQPETLELNV